MDTRIAVLIPCYNEEQTVARVVDDFKKALPQAAIHVYDNNSTDATAARAREAGAIVTRETRQGKGNVVRAMFRDVEADAYVMVDGDATYPAAHVHALLEPVLRGEADLVVGDRLSHAYDAQNTRPLHGFGNRLVRWLINRFFASGLTDIMSGYRVMNRFFVKTMPVMSGGFEIETEMTLHALDKRFRIAEMPIDYLSRPEGSESKLNTFRDGFKVLKTIAMVFKNYRPMHFFGICAALFCLLGLLAGLPPIMEYLSEQYVHRIPLAVLAAALEILAMLFFCCGLILETIVRHYGEQYELYLTAYKSRERG
ncbi:MAG: glycosyltransferase family 2 protein [Desulfovibrionaceae bacterium]